MLLVEKILSTSVLEDILIGFRTDVNAGDVESFGLLMWVR